MSAYSYIYRYIEDPTSGSVTRIEREGNLAGLISQGRFRLLEAECIVGGSRLSTYASQFLSGLLTWKRLKQQEDLARISFGMSLE
jgi:hypothetical protein